MSIWGTFFDLEDDPPYRYEGSHILPSEDDPRDPGCVVQCANVPSHITRDGRDDRPEDGQPWPWLRLSLGREDAVLDRGQVDQLHQALGAWLEQTRSSQQDAVRHVGGQANAEDCPACRRSAAPPPYPFICPGEQV